MIKSAVHDQLRVWVIKRAGRNDDSEFDFDSPLIDEGLLSSLDIVELILYIESLRGEEVEVEDLEPESFSSINTLVAKFF